MAGVTTVIHLVPRAGISSLTVKRQRLSVEAVSVKTHCFLLRSFQGFRDLSYSSYFVVQFSPGNTVDPAYVRQTASAFAERGTIEAKALEEGGNESMSFIPRNILSIAFLSSNRFFACSHVH